MEKGVSPVQAYVEQDQLLISSLQQQMNPILDLNLACHYTEITQAIRCTAWDYHKQDAAFSTLTHSQLIMN